MQPLFERQKNDALAKHDRSKIGEIDAAIRQLVSVINAKSDYYTTSSCAGRIVLLAVPESRRKDRSMWLFASHDKIKASAFDRIVFPEDCKVWLKAEPFILHICCRDINAAKSLLDACNRAGQKRSGATFGKKIKAEITGSSYLSTVIADSGRLLITREYLKYLIKESNLILAETRKGIKKLKKEIKSLSL